MAHHPFDSLLPLSGPKVIVNLVSPDGAPQSGQTKIKEAFHVTYALSQRVSRMRFLNSIIWRLVLAPFMRLHFFVDIIIVQIGLVSELVRPKWLGRVGKPEQKFMRRKHALAQPDDAIRRARYCLAID